MPIEEVRTGDFDGDGTIDILTLHDVRFSLDVETGGSKCYTAIVHWCMVGGGSVTVQCHSKLWHGIACYVQLTLLLYCRVKFISSTKCQLASSFGVSYDTIVECYANFLL